MEDKILNEWLNIDFDFIANKLKFIDSTINISEELIIETIRCLDYLTTFKKKDSLNYVITIIALMWEYIDKDKYDISRMVIKFLSRIGYPTSAIIVDNHFDRKNCKFSSLNSVLDELLTTMNQLENEVIINNKIFLLTEFQKRIWNALEKNRLVGISAPTSAGKSFVILINILNKLIENNYDIVYIVPTISLVNQVTEDFNKVIKDIGVQNCVITNSYISSVENNENHIYVLTQEKVISAFSNEENAFSKELILIVDEIQNIERINDKNEERSKILFDILVEFRYKINVKQIIISGPRIDKIDELGFNIFGRKVSNVITDVSPVLNLTYSIEYYQNKYYFKQYSLLKSDPIIKEIKNSKFIFGYGKSSYDEKYLGFLYNILENIGIENQNIVFSPTSATARTIAKYFSDKINKDDTLNDLVNYYSETIHKNYSLCKTIKKGVAYHHGKLPLHIRRTLEKAISEKKINCVVCTTTLMQGVNIPAQNIIIRNPHLYLRKRSNSAELSNYEMANLRGRAGRLLKDFIGRTYVLDESSFSSTDGYEQLELFSNVSKELPYSYEEKFEEFNEEISIALDSDKVVDKTMNEYGYLVSYIRQSVLRYGMEAQNKMNNVGIPLTKEQVAAIIQKLNNLSIPKEICRKNRYWDPFVLEKIYTSYIEDVPTSPFERGAQAKLHRMMKFLRDNEETAKMYDTYIPDEYQKGSNRSSLVKLSIQWGQGLKLNEILSNDVYNDEDGEDKIEKTIETLQNTISYKLPLLLKPIFDIKNPESIFLTCLQSGTADKLEKILIEMGIPRETAIYLHENYLNDVSIDEEDDEKIDFILRGKIKEIFPMLPSWIQVQLEYIC